MKKNILFLVFFLIIPLTLANGDTHFMHEGKLTFPVWTYYAEIVEHLIMLVIGIVGFILVFQKSKNIFLLYGFGIFSLSELLTTLHHFLIFPLGIFNAVFNHLLILIAILLIVIGIAKQK